MLVTLGRWTFPYLFFIGMTVFAMGALFSVGHYSTPSWSPALLNLSIIATCLVFRGRLPEPAYAPVIGVWLGGVAQLVAMYSALAKHSGVWWPQFPVGPPGDQDHPVSHGAYRDRPGRGRGQQARGHAVCLFPGRRRR